MSLTASAAVSGVSCFGGNNGLIDVSVVGGTAPYNYSWNNGSFDQDIDTLVAGTYVLEIYDDNGYLFFAFTQQAYWQAYNSDISSPFRETNYEPELILMIPHYKNYEEAASRIIGVSLSHQSNGRAGQLSRSWNRLKFSWVTSIGNVFINFEPWYRFKEQRKDTPEDPEGDDNPDITEYMGWFELSAAYKQENATWRLMLRNNLRSDNKGAVRLSYSRPFNQHIRLYVELFNGYGESLIDYDRSVTRLGIGFELNDIL